MKHKLSCFYYPTSVLLVDDDSDMLVDLSESLNLNSDLTKTFTDPRQALAYLSQDTYRQDLINRIEQTDDEGWGDQLLFPRWVFLEEAFRKERFQQTSVMVIDYEMPGMRGLEVCEKLPNPHIKSILLTGVADESIAIDAFNKGLIYQFIRKQDPTFLEQLQATIRQAQWEYFLELSQTPLKILSKTYGSSAFVDPYFGEYFQTLRFKHQIQEFYLLHRPGTSLLIDNRNELHSLIVADSCAIEEFLASQEEGDLTPQERQAVMDGDSVCAYFNPFTPPHCQPPNPRDWLRKAQKIQGQNQTYSVVFDKGLVQINRERIAFLK